MSDSTVRGCFVWHELLATDPKSAATFFSKVIGWKTQPWGEDGSYTLFLAGSRQVAGLMALPEEARKMGAPPSWLTYVGTPNVDDTTRLAASLGATIHKAPEDIPTVGRFAVIQDPQGASFGVYTANQPPASEADPLIGEFSWHELATTDVRAAFAFYQKLFGWEETSAMDMGPDLGTYHMFGRTKTGRVLGGMFNKPAQMPGPSSWLPYIRVPDAKKTAATVKKQGGQVVNGPMEVPGGDWIAQGLDSQGVMFAVHSLKAPATQAAAPAAPKKAAAKKQAAAKKAAPAKKKKAAAAKKRSAPKKGAAIKSKAKAKPAKKTMKKGKSRGGKKAARRR